MSHTDIFITVHILISALLVNYVHDEIGQMELSCEVTNSTGHFFVRPPEVILS